MPSEPTRHQLSSRLAYSHTTPAFLQKIRNQVAGITNDEDEEFNEWQASSGRPPIPQRPAIPERPDDDPGSADEDDEDEKPQVVVLKKGKHITAREAENERRRANGLPPIPEPVETVEDDRQGNADQEPRAPKGKDLESSGLSFSSGGSVSKLPPKKRRAPGSVGDGDKTVSKAGAKKKAKKAKTGLLSFGDEG